MLAPITSFQNKTILGRLSEIAVDPPPQNFIHLATSKSISRQHCAIAFSPEKMAWTVTCLSKNGLRVGLWA